jgi:murein L,D-transpeptidase YafK
MRKNLTFTSLILACIYLNSCTAIGALVTVGAFSPVIYEEARLHKPDLKLEPMNAILDKHNIGKNVKLPDLKLPDLKLPNIKFPSLNLFSKNKTPQLKSKKIASFDLNTFGFDCSKIKKEKNNTECFNQFSNSSNKKINKVKASKVMVKQPLASKRKAQSTNLATNNVSIPSSAKNLPPIASLYLNKWVKAWETQDVDKYLSFYSKHFKGDKNNHEDWKVSREKALVGKNKHISITLHSIQAQKNKNLIEINFIQDYSSNKHSDTGVKELVLEKNKDDWKIVKETWVQGKKFTNKNSSIKPTKFINGVLSGWLKAWAKQDINSYLSFYSDQFKDSKHDLVKWQASRKRALEKNNNLSIEASNVQISESLNKIKLNFTQQFKSDTHSDVGVKELIWIKNGNSWKILKETWVNS